MIDEWGEIHGKMGNLAHDGSDLVIKTPFKEDYKPLYYMFDGRERL